ncbi:Tautomerase/MIF superfamily [Coprinopsis sp. MPI-PUGE-AT-0042]|nr:Tautomerase/MIF superfamily [Coprinopsis sp. MPI-PUGE-AT-0042]
MPALEFKTNVKIEDEKAFALALSKVASETLGKPERVVLVNVEYSPALAFAGSFEPAFLLNVVSLDNLSAENNIKHSIQGDRGYVCFNDPGRANIAYLGTTVEALQA